MLPEEQIIARLMQASGADYTLARAFVKMYREMQRIEREFQPKWFDPAA